MMSVHDALEAWQAGHITSRRAISLTGAADVVELYGLAQECDVEIRHELTDDEERVVGLVSEAIYRSLEQAAPTYGAKIA